MTAGATRSYEPLPLWQRDLAEALAERRLRVQATEPAEAAFEGIVAALAALEEMLAAGYAPRATQAAQASALRAAEVLRRLLGARDRVRSYLGDDHR